MPVCVCVCVPPNTIYICFCALRAECRWMWLRQIFTELKSYSAFYVCMHSSWSKLWCFHFIFGRLLLIIPTCLLLKKVNQDQGIHMFNSVQFKSIYIAFITAQGVSGRMRDWWSVWLISFLICQDMKTTTAMIFSSQCSAKPLPSSHLRLHSFIYHKCKGLL